MVRKDASVSRRCVYVDSGLSIIGAGSMVRSCCMGSRVADDLVARRSRLESPTHVIVLG